MSRNVQTAIYMCSASQAVTEHLPSSINCQQLHVVYIIIIRKVRPRFKVGLRTYLEESVCLLVQVHRVLQLLISSCHWFAKYD